MDISNLNKPELLAALYNKAKVQGLGVLHATEGDMPIKEAKSIFENSQDKYFDYVKGRVMKVDLSGDELKTFLYNRDNGEGAAEKIIEGLKPIVGKHGQTSL